MISRNWDGETTERAQFAARMNDDTRFLINDVRSHAYITVGIGGLADLVCRVRVRNTDDAVSVAAAIEDYRNGVDLSDDNTYSEESVTRLGIRTDIHEFTGGRTDVQGRAEGQPEEAVATGDVAHLQGRQGRRPADSRQVREHETGKARRALHVDVPEELRAHTRR